MTYDWHLYLERTFDGITVLSVVVRQQTFFLVEQFRKDSAKNLTLQKAYREVGRKNNRSFTPADQITSYSPVARKGNLIYIASAIFGAYLEHGYRMYRK